MPHRKMIFENKITWGNIFSILTVLTAMIGGGFGIYQSVVKDLQDVKTDVGTIQTQQESIKQNQVLVFSQLSDKIDTAQKANQDNVDDLRTDIRNLYTVMIDRRTPVAQPTAYDKGQKI